MAVTFQGAIDMMFAYLDNRPDTDTEQYADALADIFLAALKYSDEGTAVTP